LRQRLVRIAGGVAMAALVVGGAAACKKDETTTGTGSQVCDLKLGFFGGLTGDNAGLVVPMKNGAAVAVAKYNEAHADCKVTLVDYDSQGAPDKATPLAQGAVNDAKVVGIVGPAFSGESEATGQIFADASLPTISPSATRPSLSTKGWKTFHRGVGNDLSQGPAAGRYLANVLKATKVFLVKDDSAYGIGLAEEVTKILGASQIGKGEVKTGDKVFTNLVTEVKNSGAAVVFYGGYTAEGGPFLSQLRDAGWTGTFIGGDGINDANFLNVGAAKVEGTIATCPCAPATSAQGTFVEDYKKMFNVAPGVYADVAHDLANIFLDGIAAGKVTRADLQAFITSYSKAGSATGVTYKFDATGELDATQVKVWAYKVVNGAWAPDQEIPKG
jgi:branched-chain amino acid transport system substrate-binding protein